MEHGACESLHGWRTQGEMKGMDGAQTSVVDSATFVQMLASTAWRGESRPSLPKPIF